MISRILELYVRSGISLKSRGLDEAAVPSHVTDEALEYFENVKWLVLGGDVYKKNNDGELESTYENWFYSGNDLRESICEARNFLLSLKGENIFIVFVLQQM